MDVAWAALCTWIWFIRSRTSQTCGEQDELAEQHGGRHRCPDLGNDRVRQHAQHPSWSVAVTTGRDGGSPFLPADVETAAKVSPLEIAKVRLDSPRPWEIENSAVLTFQMSNGSASTLTDILFEVAIVEEPQREHPDTPRRILAGPFAIRGKTVLDPGDTADFEILLRNISPTCRCAAKVRVLSYRSKGGSGP